MTFAADIQALALAASLAHCALVEIRRRRRHHRKELDMTASQRITDFAGTIGPRVQAAIDAAVAKVTTEAAADKAQALADAATLAAADKAQAITDALAGIKQEVDTDDADGVTVLSSALDAVAPPLSSADTPSDTVEGGQG